VSIKDILVHIDDSTAVESRLDLAIHYAQKHGANLRGLYPITHGFYESRDINEQSGIERISSIFKAKTVKAGISAEWVLFDSPVIGVSVTDIVTHQAYYSDLVIVGQSNFRTTGVNSPADLPERLVIACGRPVLVVPYTGLFETVGDRIMISWKTGRESVRSLHDAMPHIKKSSYVTVIGISEDEISPEGDSLFNSISSYLKYHSVDARTEQICTGKLTVGDEILNAVYEQKIDLLVMGACIPTLRGSLALSPVAQHVLKHLTVPLLMSH